LDGDSLHAFHHSLDAIPHVPILVIANFGLKHNTPVVRFGLRGLSFPVIAPSNLFGAFTNALECIQIGRLRLSTAAKNNISWNQREDGNERVQPSVVLITLRLVTSCWRRGFPCGCFFDGGRSTPLGA
jgi:hypothetical protein